MRVVFFMLCIAMSGIVVAAEPQVALGNGINRCEVIPIAEHQVSFRIEGDEKFKWNFGETYPRPFFYPFVGPSGAELTRMGHPGAPDHDHHQSIWFAYNKVNGLDFWANNKGTSIVQKQWYAYEDGDDEAIMASYLAWISPDGSEVLQQDLVAAIVPMPDNEYSLEIQTIFRVPTATSKVELEQTNFGFLAVRVAKSLSAIFGGGQLSSSEGQVGEKDIFAKRARWMDYSGPVAAHQGKDRQVIMEGITFHDHPSNHHFPTPWHVRQDGWMGAAVNLEQGITLDSDTSLTLRYLLHAHSGLYDAKKAQAVHSQFASRPGFVLSKGTKPGYQHEVRRAVAE